MKYKKIRNRISINKIDVTNIDTASGIFVGTNYSNNWSSHRKNNYGFGSVSNSNIYQNSSYVVDNDIVDTPINQNTVNVIERGKNINNNKVEVLEIKINVIDTNSALSLGENELNGWSSHGKRNGGQGRFIGEFQNTQNSGVIFDQDIIDTPIDNVNLG
jgi:hypothetical protein